MHPVLRRFTDNGDGSVTDHLTGLVWEIQDDLGGTCGWRLATFAELQTIRLPNGVPCSVNPCIDPASGTAFGSYWSSTSDVTTDGDVWFVNFGNGASITGNASKDANLMRVRAVRGGY